MNYATCVNAILPSFKIVVGTNQGQIGYKARVDS